MSRSMNTWSCARCGKAAFADQNFCRSCGMPRDGRPPAPITSQVPVIRTGVKPAGVSAEDGPEIDDLRTSAQQTSDDGHETRAPRKRPISLAMLAAIAMIFLVLGGVAAVVFGNIRDDSTDEPPATTTEPTSNTTASTTTISSPETSPTD